MNDSPTDQDQMVSFEFEQELHRHLSYLSTNQRRQVLDFARTLGATQPRGVSGRHLLQFAGAIESDDLIMISQTIAEDCETVNPHEW